MKKEMIDKINKDLVPMFKKHWKWIAGGIIFGVILSRLLFPSHAPVDTHAGHGIEGAGAKKNIKYWSCSMHPQINLPKPGKCPICAMDLIPVYEGGSQGSEDAVSLELNSVGRQLAEVNTVPVRYEDAVNELHLVGKVDYDESRLSYISAWVPGRIDKLYVDFTGTKVRKGDHLIYLYSPELFSTQEEYIQAIKNVRDTKKTQLRVMKDIAQSTLNSAEEKLRLYGITEQQIKDIAARGVSEDHMTIYSPIAGTVIHKNGFEGMYVQTGTKIYTIADLNKVWLFLDAYESDIQWVHYGQSVVVEAESYPGKTFHGKIAFIDPFVNKKTRTIRLRVNVDNKDEKLKPGMFVRATIKSILGEDGKVYETDLAGKWICPMHPDVIKDGQFQCDICGMDLVPTSEYGFTEKPVVQKKVLTIPKTAPLITGKRAIVYVETETGKEGIKKYEGREIILGPRAGDSYIVLSGLAQGEWVVTEGNFKIDSALQILAKPSMMNPQGYYHEGDGILTQGAKSPGENAAILTPAIPYYLASWRALSEDNTKEAKSALMNFKDKIEMIIEKGGFEMTDEGLSRDVKMLKKVLSVNISDDPGSLRTLFVQVSGLLRNIFSTYDYKGSKLYLMHCSMSFDGKGAYWIQDTELITNPYYGSKMLKCGAKKAEYGKTVIKQKPMPSGHRH